jgi:hypothetical protein
MLQANQDYVIGALYLASSVSGPSDPDPDKDPVLPLAATGQSVTIDPNITFVVARGGTQQVGNLIFPTQTNPGFTARFGSSFLFQPAAIPAPGTITLLGIGLVGLVIACLHRKK